MLGAFNDHRRVFIEVTKTEHDHGGAGWEFGTCLWSPERTKAGHDLYHLMRETSADDLVLHLLHDTWSPGEREHRFVGRSFVAGPVESRADGPPSPGDWAGQAPYYRLPLRDFAPFPEPVSLAAFIPLFETELRDDLNDHPSYQRWQQASPAGLTGPRGVSVPLRLPVGERQTGAVCTR